MGEPVEGALDGTSRRLEKKGAHRVHVLFKDAVPSGGDRLEGELLDCLDVYIVESENAFTGSSRAQKSWTGILAS